MGTKLLTYHFVKGDVVWAKTIEVHMSWYPTAPPTALADYPSWQTVNGVTEDFIFDVRYLTDITVTRG